MNTESIDIGATPPSGSGSWDSPLPLQVRMRFPMNTITYGYIQLTRKRWPDTLWTRNSGGSPFGHGARFAKRSQRPISALRNSGQSLLKDGDIPMSMTEPVGSSNSTVLNPFKNSRLPLLNRRPYPPGTFLPLCHAFAVKKPSIINSSMQTIPISLYPARVRILSHTRLMCLRYSEAVVEKHVGGGYHTRAVQDLSFSSVPIQQHWDHQGHAGER